MRYASRAAERAAADRGQTVSSGTRRGEPDPSQSLGRPDGGRVQSQDGPEPRRWRGQLPYLAVLIGVAAGLALFRSGPSGVRNGTLVVAAALLLAAMARLLLPDRSAGLLAARPRRWDAAALTALGLGLLVAGLIYPVPS